MPWNDLCRPYPGAYQAITYDPAGPYPYASMYIAARLAPAGPMPSTSSMQLRHALRLYGPRSRPR